MSHEFKSLRQKLVVKLGITYLLALLFVFVLILIKNTWDFNATIADTQKRVNLSLIDKGMLLVKNNSNALVGLVADNAFGAVEQIISQTVINSTDVVYGIFSDTDGNEWVKTFKEPYMEAYQSVVDKNESWSVNLNEANFKELYFDTLRIIEFSAPVIIDDEKLGQIRYGLSTAEVTNTISEANEQAKVSLLQTLIGLFTIGLIALGLTYWRTDSVARAITIPLNQLTDAANIVAAGKYQQITSINTNDEIGILTDNFNLMTNTIERTIADLAQINEIGGQLAKTRDENKAYVQVLEAILKQLEYQVAFIYQQPKDNTMITKSRVTLIELDDKALATRVTSLPEITSYLRDKKRTDVLFLEDIDCKVNDKQLRSLVFLSFGQLNSKPLYLVLLNQEKGKVLDMAEMDFCFSLRHMLNTCLKNIAMNEMLEEQNKNLEIKVEQRTRELSIQNETLSKTLAELEQTQSQLIEAEKMASLGNLVAGISHEVNTPLGVAVTAASHLHSRTNQFEKQFKQEQITKNEFVLYMESTVEMSDIILTNLDRAATLIQSFKQIAVDQSCDIECDFHLKQHLDMLVVSLQPTYKTLPIDIKVIGEDFQIKSFPGVMNQIVSNLIMNSILHGLPNCQHGEVTVTIHRNDELIRLEVSDNGKGIPDEIKKKVFDPFFTTNRGKGGTGLGLNIVYNLVTQKLKGDISIEDVQPTGTKFIISVPLV